MAHEVFISHSSKDAAIAGQVCAALEAQGIGCWIAPRNIMPGTEWLHAIMEGIRASRVVVLIVSAHAVDSPQVERELVCAVNQRLAIVPFRIETVTFSPAFEYLLCVPQWLDALTPPLQQHLPRLIETVRQLLSGATERPAERPPPAGPERPHHNLPSPPTPLIQREKELAELHAWLTRPEIRLVTLTGPGGTGKTRLGLQVATELLESFAGGVYIVFLADLREVDLVISAMAQALGVQEEGGRRLVDSLKEYLRDRDLLLLLDNFEQVMAAASLVTELMAACPRLKLLITSREPLRVRGEREYPISPLPLPELSSLPPLPELAQNAAVALFLERAAAVRPDFALTAENGAAVAEICVRLDGLPLAIELAAARIKLLPPAAMLARLENRLKLLTVGGRDLPERQRTLRGAIDWSYDLLEEGEKTLFERLSVFVGSFTLEAAEVVCNPDGDLAVDVLDGVESLVSKSLVREQTPDVRRQAPGEAPLAGAWRPASEASAAEPRFGMLATIQEYGRERLAQSGAEAAIREQHAAFFLTLAEEADRFPEFFEFFEADESGAPAAQAVLWLDRLEREHDNLRAALAWCIETGARGQGSGVLQGLGARGQGSAERSALQPELTPDPSPLAPGAERLTPDPWPLAPAEVGLRLAGALGWFWGQRGYWAEGRAHLRALLACAAAPTAERAKALHAAAWLAWHQGDYPAARLLEEEVLTLRRQLGDGASLTPSLEFLGLIARTQGDYEVARSLYTESLALHRDHAHPRGIAGSLYHLGKVATLQGDDEEAHVLTAECLEIWRKLGDRGGIAAALDSLGDLEWRRGDRAAAQSLFEESLAQRQAIGNPDAVARSLYALGQIARLLGHYPAAQSHLEERLSVWGAANNRYLMAVSLEELAKVRRDQGDYAAARAHLDESLALRRELGDRHGLGLSLQGLAMIASDEGEWQEAARLFGAAAALHEALGLPLLPADPDQRADVERHLAACRAGLGEAAFETACTAGRAMPVEQAASRALAAARS